MALNFNRSRLELARQRRGLTKVAFAAKVGIPLRTLVEWEAGRAEPDEDRLNAVARALSFPVLFFEGDDVDLPDVAGVSFRARTSLSARDRNKALGGAAIAGLLDDFIADKFELPPPSIPELAGMGAEGAAETVRSEWGLGQRPIRNMLHLLESRGVRVFSLTESSSRIDAFALWRGPVPQLFLNITKSTERVRFDCAHELGHLVLHRDGRESERRAEDEANRFASAFLMPQTSLAALDGSFITMPYLIEAKKTFGVSVVALAHRLWQLQLIKDWHYHKLCVQASEGGYRKSEPEPMPPEHSQVFSKVFSMLREDGISKFDVAAHLSVNVADVEELIFGLTLLPAQPTKVEAAQGPRVFNISDGIRKVQGFDVS